MTDSNMLFNWKVKQNHKLTLTMFSPDNFQTSTKPQRTTTTTSPSPSFPLYNYQDQRVGQQPKITSPRSHSLLNEPSSPTNANGTSTTKHPPPQEETWHFHQEYPTTGTVLAKKVPPKFERMTSAPGDLQKYTLANSGAPATDPTHQRNQARRQLTVNKSTTAEPNGRRRQRRLQTTFTPPPLQTQDSAPCILQQPSALSTPIARKANRPKPKRPFLHDMKKLASAPDLHNIPVNNTYAPGSSNGVHNNFNNHSNHMNHTNLTQSSSYGKPNSNNAPFRPPPLLQANSESSLPALLNVVKQEVLANNRRMPPRHNSSSNLLPSLHSIDLSAPFFNFQNQNSTAATSPRRSTSMDSSDSDQEMREVEHRFTSKMSINNLID